MKTIDTEIKEAIDMTSRNETEDKLIAAARQVIVLNGTEGASVEKICAKAGFTRGAFYSNFSTKEELYAAVAEAEYHRLITSLRAVVAEWSANAPAEATSNPNNFRELSGRAPDALGSEQDDVYAHQADTVLMSQLLEEALFAMRLDSEFYIIQNELLVRSVREPEWARLFHPVNTSFLRELANAMEAILKAVGRRPTGDLLALTHGVIGLALRASCVGSWVASAMAAKKIRPVTDTNNSGNRPLSMMYSQPGSEILALIVTLLHAKSEPVG